MDEIVKGLRIGAGVAIIAAVLFLGWLAYDTRQKALRGNAAADFIERVNTPQPAPAAAAAAPTPPPDKK